MDLSSAPRNANHHIHNELWHAESVGTAYVQSLMPPREQTITGGLADLTNPGPGGSTELDPSLCTVPQTVATFTNYMFGATAFEMSYALACGGWSVLLAMACTAAMTLGTGQLLNLSITEHCRMAEMEGRAPPKTYSSVVRRSLGTSAQTLLVITQYASLLLWTSGFILAMGTNLGKLMPMFHDTTWIMISSGAVLPTVWVGGNYRLMAPMAYIGLSVLAFCLVLVMYKCLDVIFSGSNNDSSNDDDVDRDFFIFDKFFAATAMQIGAFSGHVMMPALRSSMREPDRFGTVLNFAYMILEVSFLVVGTAGYLAYGNDAKTLITLNFPKGSVLSSVVQTGFVIAMYSKIGLTLNPIAVGSEKRLGKWFPVTVTHLQEPLLEGALKVSSTPPPPIPSDALTIRSVLIRSLLLGLAMALAILIPDFGFVQGLIGGSFALITVVFFPVLCYISVQQSVSFTQWTLCILLFVVTTAVSGLALYQLVKMEE